MTPPQRQPAFGGSARGSGLSYVAGAGRATTFPIITAAIADADGPRRQRLRSADIVPGETSSGREASEQASRLLGTSFQELNAMPGHLVETRDAHAARAP